MMSVTVIVRVLVVAASMVLAGGAHAAVPPIPQPVAVPTTLPPSVRDDLEHTRKDLEAAGVALGADIGDHDNRCKSVRSSDAAGLAKCQATLKDLQQKFGAHTAAVEAFNRRVADASIRAIVSREQDELDRMTDAWVRAQARNIREAAAAGRAWRVAMLESLRNAQVPPPAHRPKSLDDALPGDILLFEPTTGFSAAIPAADYFYRVASDLARGDVLGAIGKRPAPVSHALAFVKQVNSVMLFLDHTPDGSRILDRRELTRHYGERKTYLARPQAAADGKLLWAAARQAALRKQPYYGVLPGQQVCSEQACVVVSKATATPMSNNRLGPIDITPGDFFDPEATGKYFIVSPLGP